MQNNLHWLRTANRIHTSKKTYTGTSLSIANTVNAPIEKLIFDGASSQVGTPTSTVPIAITSIVNPVVTVTDNIITHTTNLIVTLLGLPNGVKDRLTIDKATQTMVKDVNIASVVINGTSPNSEVYSFTAEYTNTVRFDVSKVLPGGAIGETNKICSHFRVMESTASNEIEHVRGSSQANTGATFIFWINKSNLVGWNSGLTSAEKVNLFKTWLASNNVTVNYQTAATTTESITPYPSIATIQYLSNISKSGIASNMSADVLVMGN